ncbi:MAG: discoidin domain-containing protein, partial [Planctomycetota bacterium]
MRKKLIYSISVVLVIGGVAQAAFDTVGVYDPDDGPHQNQVDQSGAYDSHTGNAGAENVIDLAAFQALIGPAFDADGGGVVDAESGSMDGQDIVANFGVNMSKSVTFTNTVGSISRGSGGGGGNRLPISGNRRFAKDATTGDFEFDVSAVVGGAPGEVVTHFGGTLLYRDNRDMNPQVTATFSGGGTVTAVADMLMNAPSNSKDTFFGFVAPPGQGIVNVTFDLASWTHLDDLAFITSAFIVVSKEASDPGPANGATDVSRDVALSWMAAELASRHDLYLGADEQAVADADVSDVTGMYRGRLDADGYDPGRLEFGETYYWRVDEVNSPPDSTVVKGDVWSFTIELFAYPVGDIIATASSSMAGKGPENTVNGSGLDADGLLHDTDGDAMWLSDGAGPQPSWIEFEFDKVHKLHRMWVWNSNDGLEPAIGFGLKDVTIEYSVDGIDFVTLGSNHEFTQGPGQSDYAHDTTVDFGGAAARYVRLTANSNWGGILAQFGLSEVRFFSIPVQARAPEPASGATGVALDLDLGWIAGREAAAHDVYFSDDLQAVLDGTAPVVTEVEASSGPLALDLGKTYYWRVDEVNEAETPATWQGDVWDFRTIESLVVDDFESYTDNDAANEAIWQAWIDGFGVPANGSQVGYVLPPYAEQTIVHGGSQSMPLTYDNTNGVTNSEAKLTLTLQKDWTVRGVTSLSIWFRGYGASVGGFTEAPAGTFTVTAEGADIWNQADEFHYVYKQLTGVGSIVARVDSVANTDPWAKSGVMIRDTLDAGSAFAAVYITPANADGTPTQGCRFQARTDAGVNATSDTSVATAEQMAITAPYWVKIERDVAGNFRGSYSSNGAAWTSMVWRPAVSMGSTVYIGLALTSHAVGVQGRAVFSGVQTEGNVTGQWQSQDIGILSNSAEPLYVEIASGGASGVVLHDDPAATQIDAWTQWRLDLQQFADQG